MQIPVERLKMPIPFPGTTAAEAQCEADAQLLDARADALLKLCELATSPGWSQFVKAVDSVIEGLLRQLINEPDDRTAAEVRAWLGLVAVNEARLKEVERLRQHARSIRTASKS